MKAGLSLAVNPGTAAATALGAWTLARMRAWWRKRPEEVERQRRLEVNRRGRIAPGQILDVLDSETPAGGGCLILYQYEVAGVSYEAAQDVSALPDLASRAHGLPGQTAGIKYDPRRPTNSIIGCEDWCGVPPAEGTRK